MSGTLIFGQNRSTNSLHAVEVDATGVVAVDVHGGGTGSGDMKARTDIADPATSTFLKCNADGTLDISVAIDETGLATDANQTNGNQVTKCMGSEDGSTTGTQRQIHVDGSGNLLVKEVGTVNVAPSNDSNSGITNDPANSYAVGLRARTTIGDATTETFLKCDANGVLEVSSSGGGGGDATAANQVLQLAQETTTATNTATLAGAVSGNEFQCDVVTSVLPAGASTSANQSLQLAQETVTATNSTSIDNKITQGYDATVVSGGSGLQQMLCYGLDNAGDLDALRVDNSGHLEITIDDFVKGQATMANSFPVVIASDQSDVSINAPQLPASLGQKANSGSISTCRSTTTGAYDMSARTTIGTAGTSTKLLCDTAGVLQIMPLRDADVTAVTTTAVPAGGTFTSTAIDLNGFSMFAMLGNTTNLNDEMRIEVSVDNVTFFEDPTSVLVDFNSGDYVATLNQNGSTGAIRYARIKQTDGSGVTPFTVKFGASRR